MENASERSYAKITPAALDRLSSINRDVMEGFMLRNPRWLGYREKVLCVALAQGAALHFIDGVNGIKDFDVWTFFEQDESLGPFPWRGRRGIRDFGQSQWGRHPDDIGFSGRRVDIGGRSIRREPGADPVTTLQSYLRTSRATTPRLLAQKAMVLLDPLERRAEVIWPL
jgi:hypothetical protein